MRYRPLGRTGMMVSPYCLGAMMFGKIEKRHLVPPGIRSDHPREQRIAR
jgi:aryl-alcohol dehydrogenase-like predicted oxidoreductase